MLIIVKTPNNPTACEVEIFWGHQVEIGKKLFMENPTNVHGFYPVGMKPEQKVPLDVLQEFCETFFPESSNSPKDILEWRAKHVWQKEAHDDQGIGRRIIKDEVYDDMYQVLMMIGRRFSEEMIDDFLSVVAAEARRYKETQKK